MNLHEVYQQSYKLSKKKPIRKDCSVSKILQN